MTRSTSRNLTNALLALAAIATPAASQSDPTASLSFVTSDTVAPGATITIDVVCDFDTMTTDAGLFGSPGLFLFTCKRLYVTGPASSSGTIEIDPAFPSLQASGEHIGARDVRSIAGAVGNTPAVATNPVTLFSFEQTIDSDASDGATLSFDYRGSLVFDAGGELFTFSTNTPRAYTLFGSNEGTLVVDASCNAADLVAPFGTLDLADIGAFTGGFLGTDPIADINGDGVYDLTDVGMFTGAFTASCP